MDEYLVQKGTHTEQEVASDIILQILDIVLKSEHSLNNQEVIRTLIYQEAFCDSYKKLITQSSFSNFNRWSSI